MNNFKHKNSHIRWFQNTHTPAFGIKQYDIHKHVFRNFRILLLVKKIKRASAYTQKKNGFLPTRQIYEIRFTLHRKVNKNG